MADTLTPHPANPNVTFQVPATPIKRIYASTIDPGLVVEQVLWKGEWAMSIVQYEDNKTLYLYYQWPLFWEPKPGCKTLAEARTRAAKLLIEVEALVRKLHFTRNPGGVKAKRRRIKTNPTPVPTEANAGNDPQDTTERKD